MAGSVPDVYLVGLELAEQSLVPTGLQLVGVDGQILEAGQHHELVGQDL